VINHGVSVITTKLLTLTTMLQLHQFIIDITGWQGSWSGTMVLLRHYCTMTVIKFYHCNMKLWYTDVKIPTKTLTDIVA